MPSVSVIVPVYNTEPYVAQCVRSLFGQTLEDVEFIFIDDASTDKSMAVIEQVLEEEFPLRKSQVKLFKMPVNCGPAKVRMQGISIATGDYIIFCDSDDQLTSMEAYRSLFEKACAENLDIVTCNYLRENASHQLQIVKGRCQNAHEILLDKAQGGLFCRLTRHSLFDGVLPPVGNMGEDLVLSLQVTLRAKTIGHIDEVFYLYKFHETSISKKEGKDAAIRRHNALVSNIQLLVKLLKNSYGYTDNDRWLICFKYYARHCIEPFVGDNSCFILWKETFPEVDNRLLFTPGIGWERKMWFILIHLRLYPLIKRFTRKNKQD